MESSMILCWDNSFVTNLAMRLFSTWLLQPASRWPARGIARPWKCPRSSSWWTPGQGRTKTPCALNIANCIRTPHLVPATILYRVATVYMIQRLDKPIPGMFCSTSPWLSQIPRLNDFLKTSLLSIMHPVLLHRNSSSATMFATSRRVPARQIRYDMSNLMLCMRVVPSSESWFVHALWSGVVAFVWLWHARAFRVRLISMMFMHSKASPFEGRMTLKWFGKLYHVRVCCWIYIIHYWSVSRLLYDVQLCKSTFFNPSLIS